jgi:hypothetical protein
MPERQVRYGPMPVFVQVRKDHFYLQVLQLTPNETKTHAFLPLKLIRVGRNRQSAFRDSHFSPHRNTFCAEGDKLPSTRYCIAAS